MLRHSNHPKHPAASACLCPDLCPCPCPDRAPGPCTPTELNQRAGGGPPLASGEARARGGEGSAHGRGTPTCDARPAPRPTYLSLPLPRRSRSLSRSLSRSAAPRAKALVFGRMAAEPQGKACVSLPHRCPAPPACPGCVPCALAETAPSRRSPCPSSDPGASTVESARSGGTRAASSRRCQRALTRRVQKGSGRSMKGRDKGSGRSRKCSGRSRKGRDKGSAKVEERQRKVEERQGQGQCKGRVKAAEGRGKAGTGAVQRSRKGSGRSRKGRDKGSAKAEERQCKGRGKASPVAARCQARTSLHVAGARRLALRSSRQSRMAFHPRYCLPKPSARVLSFC